MKKRVKAGKRAIVRERWREKKGEQREGINKRKEKKVKKGFDEENKE